jgi:hypothetical protein
MRTVLVTSTLTSVVVATVTVLVMMALLPGTGQRTSTIRARQFEVVDDQGRVRARFGGAVENPELTILGTGGENRVGLRLLADGTAVVYAADGENRVRAGMYVNEGGSRTAIQLFDENGVPQRAVTLP